MRGASAVEDVWNYRVSRAADTARVALQRLVNAAERWPVSIKRLKRRIIRAKEVDEHPVYAHLTSFTTPVDLAGFANLSVTES